MKISKIGVTRCQILRLNAPNSISAGAAPQTPLGELTALLQWGSLQRSPDTTFYSRLCARYKSLYCIVFKGLTSKEREGKRKGKGKGRGKERKGESRGGEGRGELAPQLGSLDPPVLVDCCVRFCCTTIFVPSELRQSVGDA